MFEHVKIGSVFGPWAMLAGVALAQALPTSEGPAGVDWSTLSATGILAYFAWHVLNKTLPEIRAENREEAIRRDVAHAEQLVMFRNEMQAEREARREDARTLAAAIERFGERTP